MKESLKIPVQFTKPVFRADKSVKLEFETREFTGLEASILLDYRQHEGWLIFSPNDDLTEADIPDEKADSMTGQKTQAQRLRGVIFRLWEQNGNKGDSETYYRAMLEKVIDQFKEKLE